MMSITKHDLWTAARKEIVARVVGDMNQNNVDSQYSKILQQVQ